MLRNTGEFYMEMFSAVSFQAPFNRIFQAMSSFVKVVNQEQRAHLVIHSSLAEGRLQDYHLSTLVHTFSASYKGSWCSSWGNRRSQASKPLFFPNFASPWWIPCCNNMPAPCKAFHIALTSLRILWCLWSPLISFSQQGVNTVSLTYRATSSHEASWNVISEASVHVPSYTEISLWI